MPAAMVEDRLRTYMLAGLGVEELEDGVVKAVKKHDDWVMERARFTSAHMRTGPG